MTGTINQIPQETPVLVTGATGFTGTALTVKLARLHRKPVYIFDFEADALNQDPEKIWLWGHENNVYVLNVAGPRESGQPGTRDLVEAVMLRLLVFARGAYPVVVK